MKKRLTKTPRPRTDPQAKEELGVFHLFAPVSGLDINLSSIEKRDPPEPDIFCQTDGAGAIAFEMVRLIDSDGIAKPEADRITLEKEIQKYYDSLLESTQNYLKERLRNASISIYFHRQKTLKVCLRSIPKIFNALLDSPADSRDRLYVGKMRDDLIAAIEFLPAGEKKAFRFCVSYGGAYLPLPINALNKKLSKSYITDAPIELVAYFGRIGPPIPQAELTKAISRIDEIADHEQRISPFRRIWLFDAGTGEIIHDRQIQLITL